MWFIIPLLTFTETQLLPLPLTASVITCKEHPQTRPNISKCGPLPLVLWHHLLVLLSPALSGSACNPASKLLLWVAAVSHHLPWVVWFGTVGHCRQYLGWENWLLMALKAPFLQVPVGVLSLSGLSIVCLLSYQWWPVHYLRYCLSSCTFVVLFWCESLSLPWADTGSVGSQKPERTAVRSTPTEECQCFCLFRRNPDDCCSIVFGLQSLVFNLILFHRCFILELCPWLDTDLIQRSQPLQSLPFDSQAHNTSHIVQYYFYYSSFQDLMCYLVPPRW